MFIFWLNILVIRIFLVFVKFDKSDEIHITHLGRAQVQTS